MKNEMNIKYNTDDSIYIDDIQFQYMKMLHTSKQSIYLYAFKTKEAK